MCRSLPPHSPCSPPGTGSCRPRCRRSSRPAASGTRRRRSSSRGRACPVRSRPACPPRSADYIWRRCLKTRRVLLTYHGAALVSAAPLRVSAECGFVPEENCLPGSTPKQLYLLLDLYTTSECLQQPRQASDSDLGRVNSSKGRRTAPRRLSGRELRLDSAYPLARLAFRRGRTTRPKGPDPLPHIEDGTDENRLLKASRRDSESINPFRIANRTD